MLENKKIKILYTQDNFLTPTNHICFFHTNFTTIHTKWSETIFEKIKSEKPHLLLLDINKPNTTTIKRIEEIRKAHNIFQLPILILSETTNPNVLANLFAIGINDYLIKPLAPDIIYLKIFTQLRSIEKVQSTIYQNECELLRAIVTTYSHEINNPLAIAIGYLSTLTQSNENSNAINRLETMLWRIAQVVKKIKWATENRPINYATYGNDKAKIIKI